jgi:hypothetical protein
MMRALILAAAMCSPAFAGDLVARDKDGTFIPVPMSAFSDPTI